MRRATHSASTKSTSEEPVITDYLLNEILPIYNQNSMKYNDK